MREGGHRTLETVDKNFAQKILYLIMLLARDDEKLLLERDYKRTKALFTINHAKSNILIIRWSLVNCHVQEYIS